MCAAYAVHDTKKYNEFKVIDFTPKTLEADDVEISIHYCGVCASDVHTMFVPLL
jgi:alcohol dehydrogenase (NADP+)